MIEHRLKVDPRRRVVKVSLTAFLEGADEVLLAFPVWTPGSYLVREHQRHVNDLAAEGPDGPMEVRKEAKNAWRIVTGGQREVRLSWEVYAHELTVRTSHVDGTHAFLNPVTLCGWLEGRAGEPQRLFVEGLPENWGVVCPLERDAAGAFLAADFDELADSPLECGPHATAEALGRFEAEGARFEVAIWGRAKLDRERWMKDTARIVQAQAKLFGGGVPFERYVILLHLTDQVRGGLEHKASCALAMTRQAFDKPKGYEELLALTSHEIFHAWNVKRIRPAAMLPYDFTRENHTRLLWAFEGLTSYYEYLALRRAGLVSAERIVEEFSERLTRLAKLPGRERLSVEAASFDAWVRLYRPHEDSDNSGVSYYLKGSLIGLLLDLEIRRRTDGKRSLDDVMRLLWERHGRPGLGVPEDGVERLAEEVAGESLQALFEVAVRGTGELPLTEALQAHGISLDRRVSTGPEDRGGKAKGDSEAIRGWTGLVTSSGGGKVTISAIRRGSPADDSGMAPGDELVAIDGLRVTTGSVFDRLHREPAGTRLEITAFRRDELIQVQVPVGEPPRDTVVLEMDTQAPDQARALREAWLAEA